MGASPCAPTKPETRNPEPETRNSLMGALLVLLADAHHFGLQLTEIIGLGDLSDLIGALGLIDLDAELGNLLAQGLRPGVDAEAGGSQQTERLRQIVEGGVKRDHL